MQCTGSTTNGRPQMASVASTAAAAADAAAAAVDAASGSMRTRTIIHQLCAIGLGMPERPAANGIGSPLCFFPFGQLFHSCSCTPRLMAGRAFAHIVVVRPGTETDSQHRRRHRDRPKATAKKQRKERPRDTQSFRMAAALKLPLRSFLLLLFVRSFAPSFAGLL